MVISQHSLMRGWNKKRGKFSNERRPQPCVQMSVNI
nr:MAG TPA_asm: hypothetical protein [Caudoviricetes sp.]